MASDSRATRTPKLPLPKVQQKGDESKKLHNLKSALADLAAHPHYNLLGLKGLDIQFQENGNIIIGVRARASTEPYTWTRATDIESQIEAWHENQDGKELHEYLGMTHDQYAAYVEKGLIPPAKEGSS